LIVSEFIYPPIITGKIIKSEKRNKYGHGQGHGHGHEINSSVMSGEKRIDSISIYRLKTKLMIRIWLALVF